MIKYIKNKKIIHKPSYSGLYYTSDAYNIIGDYMNKKEEVKEKENLLKVLENAKYYIYCRINKNGEEKIKYGSKSD